MSNPELVLLSNVIADGDFAPLRQRNVSADLFLTDDAQEVFKWLYTEVHDPRNKGVVPPKEKLTRRFHNFDWCPDPRQPTEALIDELVQRQVRAKLLELLNEADELIHDQAYDPQKVLESVLARGREIHVKAVDEDGLSMSGSAALIEQRYRSKEEIGGLTGIPYPWGLVNTALGGMNPEEFIVIYARPKQLKTWLLCNMGAHAYEHNARVLVYSKEMSKIQMMERTACCLFGVDYTRFKQGKLSEDDAQGFFDGMRYLEELEKETSVGTYQRSLLFISDQGQKEGGTVDSLEARAEKFEPTLILADGFYHMSSGKKNPGKDWERVMDITRGLKSLSQRMKIPIAGTTQATRGAARTDGSETDEVAFSDAIGQEVDVLARCFKGKGPTGSNCLLLTWPAVREAQIDPFLINAIPGGDFSVLQNNVNVREFLKKKTLWDAEEEEAENAKATKRPKKSNSLARGLQG